MVKIRQTIIKSNLRKHLLTNTALQNFAKGKLTRRKETQRINNPKRAKSKEGTYTNTCKHTQTQKHDHNYQQQKQNNNHWS